MVVLCAAIVNKNENFIIRHYNDTTIKRIDSLLSSFRQFAGSTQCKEEDNVRFLCITLNNQSEFSNNNNEKNASLYLVLITDLGSNLLSDFETLRTIKFAINSICTEQTKLNDKYFNIIFILDDIINLLGETEYVNEYELRKSAITLDSYVEKIVEKNLKEKERKAADLRLKKSS